MRKTSRAFLTVGAILGIIAGLLLIIVGILMVMASFAKPTDELIKIFDAVIKAYFNGSIDAFQKSAMVYGIVVVICSICALASAVFCFMAKRKPALGTLVAVIILSALGGSVFATLGGIFGLIANSQEKRAQVEAPKEEPLQ